MVIAGGVRALFAKIGVGRDDGGIPYEPYIDPEPERRLRRVSSHLSTRRRNPSIVQSACLSVHKIPAIVAASGIPDAPPPRTRFLSNLGSPTSARHNRHSTAGWHACLSPGDPGSTFSRRTERPNANQLTGSGSRTDRSATVPPAIDLPPSYDFRDLDQNKEPHSAPSDETRFRTPDIQVTSAERRSPGPHERYIPQPGTTSYDFVDLDRDSLAPLLVPGSSSPSPSSIHRSPSPAMGQSHRSIPPTLGHTPYYSGSQRRDYPLSAPQRSTTPLQRNDPVSSATQSAKFESYDFVGMDRPPSATHEDSEYAAYYCTSPMPISAYGNRHGTSRDNTYDSTRGDAYASNEDIYDDMQEDVYNLVRPAEGASYTTHGQTTGLSTLIAEMEDYNRAHVPRFTSAPSGSPTVTISVDGTINSPYEY